MGIFYQLEPVAGDFTKHSERTILVKRKYPISFLLLLDRAILPNSWRWRFVGFILPEIAELKIGSDLDWEIHDGPFLYDHYMYQLYELFDGRRRTTELDQQRMNGAHPARNLLIHWFVFCTLSNTQMNANVFCEQYMNA